MFASIFSGYTVSGIPNEAYRTGWLALRWVPQFVTVAVGLMGTGFRLRKAGVLRNHSSPVDFITDRYQSQMLRYTVVFLQLLPTVIYLAVQVVSIQRTFNNIFGLDPSASIPTILIMGLILAFEFIGGLSSVALTDTIQAFALVFGFIFVPIVIVQNFGGWNELDPFSYPKREFYQTPTNDAQWLFWQFTMVNLSFFTLPHMVQRVYAARDLKSLKVGYAIISLGPWLNFISAIFIGTMGVAILINEDGSPMETKDAYSEILAVLMSMGGFAEITSAIAITASLAAIMSTADSLIIAVSHLVTVEIIEPLLSRASSEHSNYMVWYGRTASLVAVILALVIGLYWNGEINDMAAIQFPLSTQALPAFLFGLFSYNRRTDVHPWTISMGALAGILSVFGIYFGHLKSNPDSLPINAGIAGICLNVFVIVTTEGLQRLFGRKSGSKSSLKGMTIGANGDDEDFPTTELLYPNRPSWDIPNVKERFGEKTLTPQMLWKSMEGVKEPLTNWSWILLMFIAISYVTPLTAENQPPLRQNGTFFSHAPPAVVNGLPWWVFKIILTSIVPCFFLYASIYQLPNAFPETAEEQAAAPPSKAFSFGHSMHLGSEAEAEGEDLEPFGSSGSGRDSIESRTNDTSLDNEELDDLAL
jgi:Na+/proline symporter